MPANADPNYRGFALRAMPASHEAVRRRYVESHVIESIQRRSSQQRMERLRAEHAAAKEALFEKELVLGTPFIRKKLTERARNAAIQRMVGGDPALLMTPRFQDIEDQQALLAEATLTARSTPRGGAMTPRAGAMTPGATSSSVGLSASGALTARGRFFGEQPMTEKALSAMVPLPPIEALMNPVMVPPQPDKERLLENDPELSLTAGSRAWRAQSREAPVGPTSLSALLRQLHHATELKLEADKQSKV